MTDEWGKVIRNMYIAAWLLAASCVNLLIVVIIRVWRLLQ